MYFHISKHRIHFLEKETKNETKQIDVELTVELQMEGKDKAVTTWRHMSPMGNVRYSSPPFSQISL